MAREIIYAVNYKSRGVDVFDGESKGNGFYKLSNPKTKIERKRLELLGDMIFLSRRAATDKAVELILKNMQPTNNLISAKNFKGLLK